MKNVLKLWCLRLVIAILLLPAAYPADAAKLAGYWEFTSQAATGTDGQLGYSGITLSNGKQSPPLVVVGTTPTFSSTLSDGATSLSGAITTVRGTANRLKLTHGIAPNGGSTTLVNKYTLMFDVFSPSASRSQWRCFFQTDPTNASDGDYFIKNSSTSPTMGTADLGYSSAVGHTVWKRIVIAVDLGSSFKVYVDGSLFYTHTTQAANGRYALASDLLLFADENSENYAQNVAAVAIWDGAMTAAEAAALGKAGTAISVANQKPSILQGSETTLDATKDGGPATLTLTGSDPDDDSLTWSISTQPQHGSVSINSNNQTCPVTYTPEAGYEGTDSFVMSVTDGNFTVQTNINVIVAPNATPLLVGLWEFNDAGNRNKATIGFDFETSGSGFTEVSGITDGDGAMEVAKGSFYRAIHGVQPNGKNGANLANNYTIMWDIKIPTASASVFKTLLQTTVGNSDDGDLFISSTNNIGTAAGVGGYSSTPLSTSVWHRVVLSIHNGTSRNIYVDGTKVYTGSVVGSIDEARYGLGSKILFFADDNGEDGAIDVSNVAVWNDSLTDEQIGLLGSSTSAIDATIPAKPRPSSLWQFDESTRLEAASIGSRIFRQGTGFTSAEGVTGSDGAVEVGIDSSYLVKHGIPANGGGTKVNEYTILWDIKYSSAATAKALYQTNLANADAAELFIGTDGKLGSSALGGFSSQATFPDTWYRVMLVVKNGTQRSLYVNGKLWLNGNAGTVDDDYALDPAGLLAFADSNGQDGAITVSNLAVWDHAVTDREAYAMGSTSGTVADGIAAVSPNTAPVISEGASYTLNAAKNGEAKNTTLHASDADGDSLDWSVNTAPNHGSATVTGSGTSCVVAYTPVAGYAGLDSFVVQVSDGWIETAITFNVSMVDAAADPVLTVVSPYGTANPAPGKYSHPRGTELTNTVADEGSETTRRHCIGWSMVGDGPNEGESNTMSMTLTRDSTLTWLWQTEHRVETAVSGSGTISVPSGWYLAGRPIQITAVPSPGYYFAGWMGDTAGCTIGGKNIVLPMDRPYAAITAKFMQNESFTVIGLPDTQNYCRITNVTDIFTQQTQWVLQNKDILNIKFLTHFGDIVDSATSTSQWLRATDAMDLLDDKLPYGVCTGNHDLANGSTHYIDRFGPSHSRWVDPSTSTVYDWYQGASPRGYSSYQVINVNGRDFMFLHLDCDAPDSDIAWAATVLSQHPRTLTMLTTHDYMAETGAYSSSGSGTGKRGRVNYPTPYISVGPDRNTVTEIWNTVVKPFNQVYMVVCGHNFAQYNVESTNDAGKIVHEVLADYQTLPNGGNGFLRIMEFRPSSNEIYNTTFSPYLGRYMSNSSSPSAQLTSDNTGMLDLTDKDGGEFSITTDFDTRFNSTLTVVSEQPAVSPAVGQNSIEDGTPIVATANDNVVGQTRYKCTGWSLTGSQTASGAGNTASFTMNGNATLTWNWTTQYYLSTQTVGRGIISVNNGWQAAGATVNILAQPDAGFTFIGWSGDVEGCTVDGESITVPMDRGRGPVIARFSSPLAAYNVQVVSPYASVVPAPASYSYENGSQVLFTAQSLTEGGIRRVCTGWTAIGATVNTSGTGSEATLTITENLTLTWLWKTQYQLQTAVNGQGTVSGGAQQWIDEGGTVSVTATPNTGSGFSEWSGDTSLGTANGNVFTIAQMTRAVGPLTANFSLGFHTLTIVSDKTTTAPAPGAHTLPYGSVVNFSATPEENGRRRETPVQWTITSGTVTTSGTTTEGTLTLTDETTLTWNWQSEVVLELAGGLEGSVLPTNTAGWRKLGEVLTFRAIPSDNFEFARWNGDVAGTQTAQTLTISMDQPRLVAADFTPVKAPNGTPKWWLERHAYIVNGDLAAAEQSDADRDGQTAEQEYLSGMDDLDGGKIFAIKESKLLAGGSSPAVEIKWPGVAHRRYSVWSSSNLTQPFTLVAENIEAVEPFTSTQVALSGGSEPLFLKIKASLAPGGSLDGDSPASTPEPKEGCLIREMQFVPAGLFTMGDNDHGEQSAMPAHKVYTAAYFMDKFEVTLADWQTVATWAAAHGYDLPVDLVYAPPSNHPAPGVSWYNAVKWCNARSEMEGRVPVYYTDTETTQVYRTGTLDLASANVNWAGNGYRLPTEAEWEKACRGGIEGKAYGWGDEPQVNRANGWLYQVAINHTEAAYPLSTPVGYFNGNQDVGGPDAANAYGIYDMNGNAWEWVWDRYAAYDSATQFNPKGPDSGDVRITRGGSWWNNEADLLSSHRYPFPAIGEDVYGMISFRCMRVAAPNEQ